MEPKQLQHAGDAPVKKQVKIKMEPTVMKEKGKKLSPVTPVEKMTKPMQKPLERNNVDLSSKFFLPQVDDDLDVETPTRKRSGSKGHDAKMKKKQKIEEAIALTKTLSTSVPHSTSTPEKVKPTQKAVAPAPQASLETDPVTAPPPFKAMNMSVLDEVKDGLFFDEAFKNIEDAALRGEYIHAAAKTFDQWVSHGVSLIDKKHELVKDFIVERVKLDAKFRVIFAAVNKYNQGLESKDEELKKKLIKLQNVGQEIKALINC